MLINNNIIFVYLYNKYMNKLIFGILLSLIFVIAVLAIILFFFLYKIFKNKKRRQTILKLSKNLKADKVKRCDIVLSRIRKIADSNNKFLSLYERLSLKWDKISDNVQILNNHISKLLLSFKKLNKNEFKKEINEISSKINLLNEIELSFDNEALKVTRQDEFTRSEKSFYDKNLRIAINVYKDKRILLDKISPKIDKLINEISEINKEFEVILSKANAIEINQKLLQYSKKVIQFCDVVNKGPSLQNYIYNKIPKMIEELYNFYRTKKNELKISLKHINFANSIEKISVIHFSSRKYFLDLKLDKAEQETKNIIKSTKIIEKFINSEIKSRNSFVKNYDILLDEIKLSLTEFVKIKSKIKSINLKKLNVSYDFKKNFQEFLELSKVIDNEGLEIKSLINMNSIPFSSKLSRMKLFSQKLNEFIDYINKINKYIFELDINGAMLKNKFSRATSAFNDLSAKIKEKNIRLSKKEIDSIEKIYEQISLSNSKILNNNITNEDVEYIKNTINNIILTYKLIGGTVQIVEIINSLINNLSIDRAINKDLNYQIGIAEREYLEGKYASSLNAIIQYLEGVA